MKSTILLAPLSFPLQLGVEKNVEFVTSQLTVTCSKSTIERREKGVNYV